MVEQCGKVHNWSDEAKVNAASLNLRDTAHTWSILYFRKTKNPESWATFKEAFLERFHRRTTISDKQALLSKLRQKPTKLVDFMDRIDLTLLDIPKFSSEKGSTYFFLQGILPGVKKFIKSNKDLKEKEDFLSASHAWERANPCTPPPLLINSMNPETTEMDNYEPEDADEVDAINSLAESLNTLFRRRKRKFPR